MFSIQQSSSIPTNSREISNLDSNGDISSYNPCAMQIHNSSDSRPLNAEEESRVFDHVNLKSIEMAAISTESLTGKISERLHNIEDTAV